MISSTLLLTNGVRVVVPDSLHLLTPYVLQEQQDWFEYEIKFIRILLKPGQKVIDIGANYGVYSLSMAHEVGKTGCVWAFEPASNTAKFLAKGIAVNGFSQVVLEQKALSCSSGTAHLSLNENAEMNALVQGAQPTAACEAVPLVTLDECLARYGWRDIEFMKIDAEGEEANILNGGRQFFAELSPLVMFEIKAGEGLHLELVQHFSSLGYKSYRLIPGLNLLVPFDAKSTPDEYLLNLFCCKRDRAEQLAARGLLVDSVPNSHNSRVQCLENIRERINNSKAYGWRQTIARLPYGKQLAKRWEQTMAAGKSAKVDEALSFYAVSRDISVSSSERFFALEESHCLLKDLCELQPAYLRLASLARVARDFGVRSVAVKALQQASQSILQQKKADTNEPFLAPLARFDSVPPGESFANWVLAAALEGYEQLESFSSYYTGVSARQRLEIIRSLGYGGAEMERRLRLLKKRFALP